MNVLESLGHLHQYLCQVGNSEASSLLSVFTDDISQVSTCVQPYTFMRSQINYELRHVVHKKSKTRGQETYKVANPKTDI